MMAANAQNILLFGDGPRGGAQHDARPIIVRARQRTLAGAAVREAERMAMTAAGAVAFSRTGDPASGAFEDAVVIRRFGEVPDVDALLGGA